MPGVQTLQSLSFSLSLPWRSWPRPPNSSKKKKNTRKWWFSYDSAALAFLARLREEGRMEGGGEGRRKGRRNAQRR